MDEFLQLGSTERALYFEQAAARTGFTPAVIEKDFWVCWTLQELFRLPKWGEQFLFKGGTSLSKGWKLIKRFSEDIDIVVNREYLGYTGDHSISGKRLKQLRKVCGEVVRGEIAEGLQKCISAVTDLQLRVDDTDPDGQTLLVEYSSRFMASESYLRPAVKIEMGARSDMLPSEEIGVVTMLQEALPESTNQSPVKVRALSPVRTFWEKAMLLHEEGLRPESKKRKTRMARHYYDLWCLMHAGIGRRALEDRDLFHQVAGHRRVFFRQAWVDYDALITGGICITPPDNQMKAWEEDYLAMQTFFFPESIPQTWQEIMGVISEFDRRFSSFQEQR